MRRRQTLLQRSTLRWGQVRLQRRLDQLRRALPRPEHFKEPLRNLLQRVPEQRGMPERRLLPTFFYAVHRRVRRR